MKRQHLLHIILISIFTSYKACSGSVWAWGFNEYGQLNVPPDLTNVVAISAGGYHAVALRSDGTVVAWGDNSFGQTNVPPGLTNVVAVDAGNTSTLALRADGRVVAWGSNNSGQLDVPPNLDTVIAVCSGNDHDVALKADGRVVVWGGLYPADWGQTNVPADLTNAVAVTAGSGFSAALRANGTVTTWGKTGDGPIPVPEGLTNVVAISAGFYHVLCLLANGTVSAFGLAFSGQTQLNVPPGLTNVIAVSAGALWSLALKSDGTVVAWGGNTNPPAGLMGVTAISAGKNTPDWNLALANVSQPKVVINFVWPVSQTVGVGSQAFFSVSASGQPPLSYQWYFGTNALVGETKAWLAIYNVQAPQAGTYTIMVSNSQGSATSQPLTLNVVPSLDVNMVPAITLKGWVGLTYQIDYVNAIGPGNVWNPLATVTLTNSEQFYFDISAIGQPVRFYRAVKLP